MESTTAFTLTLPCKDCHSHQAIRKTMPIGSSGVSFTDGVTNASISGSAA
jgi:hypothetical protein